MLQAYEDPDRFLMLCNSSVKWILVCEINWKIRKNLFQVILRKLQVINPRLYMLSLSWN